MQTFSEEGSKRPGTSREFSFLCENSGLRLDQFIALQFPAVSLTNIRRVIREGRASVNGTSARQGWILQAKDRVAITLDPSEPTSALPEDIPLEILHEDADLLIINKAAGLLSHPSNTEKSGSVMNAVAYYLLHRASGMSQDLVRPILLHRLDRETSGVLALALNERAGRIVSKAFRDRKVAKSYLALVHGVVEPDEGLIDAPIGRAPGQWPRWRVADDGVAAKTKYTVKERFASHTLIEMDALTGRTHQLRIHAAHIGHPIVGDKVYRGNGDATPAPWPGEKPRRQLLHARTLSFRHPTGGEQLSLEAPLPADLSGALDSLRRFQ
jgi:23S rRNA pseudouridine1911/1915/1917 synthase